MLLFFRNDSKVYAVGIEERPDDTGIDKLSWLFSARILKLKTVKGPFVGPRREMITPWSTNAVEICQNMGLEGITRIEEFTAYNVQRTIDPMLEQRYDRLDQEIFTIRKKPDPMVFIDDLSAYNRREGLALSEEEIDYLEALSRKIGRKLTDSEVFGFSQVNSEHCRHKIFNGEFIIDGKKKRESLFSLIKKTSKANPNLLVSAYKDNVAFIAGPSMEQFAPDRQDIAGWFKKKAVEAVISLKAETHNFPTTVEPFNGAATGSGGEIRDRMAGGRGSIPVAGTAVYMTSYPRLEKGRTWEKKIPARPWLYKHPEDILIKASNGASDFGNKFGQPLICGSVLTFEHAGRSAQYGYDKVIMLAGGIGYGRKEDSIKQEPGAGQEIVVMGGDNYRIGMGGGAVSSVATGEYGNAIELNAVQRSNPEMQKRVFNAIRAMTELDRNPIVSIHDHGAGGHLNSISELVENTGGTIDIRKLPVGDPTLSDKEIISNESQERMGLVIRHKDAALLKKITERERAPYYSVGETTGDHLLTFHDGKNKPVDLKMEDFFGKPPKTVMKDASPVTRHPSLKYTSGKIFEYLDQLLQIEAVACKDWLTNKVDRSVSGKIAMQQTCGEIQLPLNNLGIAAMDYTGTTGIATSLGHAPAAALIDAEEGSRLAVAEALTNLVWAPLTHGLKGVSLSANWMWPCRNPGEDARLYAAVEAVSRFAIGLGINIPTGKDSLSMTQKYPGGKAVLSPGTVIITAVAEVSDVRKAIRPALKPVRNSSLIYIPFGKSGFELGGSSFAQVLNGLGDRVPHTLEPKNFKTTFTAVQKLILDGKILAGHDIGSGGLITTLLEMAFAVPGTGIRADFNDFRESDLLKILFSEKPGIVIQVKSAKPVLAALKKAGVAANLLGTVTGLRTLEVCRGKESYLFAIDELRDTWFRTSYLLDRRQSGEKLALARFENYGRQPLQFRFSEDFTGTFRKYGIDPRRKKTTGIRAAIIREKGVNRDRDMAYAMYLAGFDVKDVHMTDLVSGREDLSDVNFIAFVGGFSNSDVLGSAKGWAGAFLYNDKARKALDAFYSRYDTLSLGVCNGCQLMVELGLLYPEHPEQPHMSWNDSHKYESAFLTVEIGDNHSVMLGTLAGSKLGIWVAHGEGKFNFPYSETNYHIPAKFAWSAYPGNPNGSMFDAACIASADGRHLAIMPHLEDSVLPWQWAHYPDGRTDEVTPWIEAFVNAREWLKRMIKN